MSNEWCRNDKEFSDLGVASWLCNAASHMKMMHPTEIQVRCVPLALQGQNLIGSAKTGSGKTAAFAMPMLQQLSKDPYGVFGLVLTPVRELSSQIADQFIALGKGIGVNVLLVTGGSDMIAQKQKLAERPHIVIATPGRLADLLDYEDMQRCFRKMKVLVMDEADRLLEESFQPDMAAIFQHLPQKRQTMLFSATITNAISALQKRFSEKGEMQIVDANPDDHSVETLTQQYMFMPKAVQLCYLHFLLKEHFSESSAMIFVPTVAMCQQLNSLLEVLGFSVCCLHSLQDQKRRIAGLTKFKVGKTKILVATDVASRGLDIPKVAVVVNMGLPHTVDDYIHRVGRTARAGRTGLAISLISQGDTKRVAPVEERIGKKLELFEAKEDDILKLMTKTSKAQAKAQLLLSEIGFDEKVAEFKRRKRVAREERSDAAGEKRAKAA